jgi:hypothetical protein
MIDFWIYSIIGVSIVAIVALRWIFRGRSVLIALGVNVAAMLIFILAFGTVGELLSWFR